MKTPVLYINTPEIFSFKECCVYLSRSDNEIMHTMDNGYMTKLIEISGEIRLLRISEVPGALKVELMSGAADDEVNLKITDMIRKLFDLDTPLEPFYKAAGEDAILAPLVKAYYGLRIIKITDIFESLCWAIIGQQINLTFAYTLKRRFVEAYGRRLNFEGKDYWLFPLPSAIVELDVDDLRKLQFTGKKAEYIIGLAKEITAGRLSREILESLDSYAAVKLKLTSLKGVGDWTADYVILKSLHWQNALPSADAGLQNALKQQLGLPSKPTPVEVCRLAGNWQGWEAYGTFYLWRSLY